MELTAWEVDLVIAGAFHVNASTMRFNDAFGKSQPQACAAAFEAGFAGGVFAQLARLIELRKYDLAEVRVYAYACIADDDFHSASGKVKDGWDAVACDGNFSIIGREFDRIANDMVE